MTFRIAQISDTHLSDDKPFFVDNFVRIGEALRADQARPRAQFRRHHARRCLERERSRGGARCCTTARPAGALPARQPRSRRLRRMRRARRIADRCRTPRALPRAFRPRLVVVRRAGLARARPQRPAAGQRPCGGRTCRTLRSPKPCESLGARRLALFLHKPLFDRSVDESEITGRFVNPAPRRRLFDCWAAWCPALVVCGHVHQYRSDRKRRRASCLGTVDGLRHARPHPAALRHQGSRLRRAHASSPTARTTAAWCRCPACRR